MTGLFDRLAVRAMGSDHAAAPRLASLFEPHDDTEPASGLADVDSELTAPGPRPRAPARDHGRVADRRDAWPADDRAERTRRVDRDERVRQLDRHVVDRPAFSMDEPSDRPSGRSDDPRRPETIRASVREAPSAPQRSHVVQAEEEHHEIRHQVEPVGPARRTRHEATSMDPDGHVASIGAASSADVLDGWSVDPSPPPSTGDPRGDAEPTASGDRTVTVSIGRIDVRSPSPPRTTSPRRRPEVAPHISLDQYLRDRT